MFGTPRNADGGTLAFDPDALRRIRREGGVTQRDLAGALGVTVPTVCRYETRASTPSMDVIDLMAQVSVGNSGSTKWPPTPPPQRPPRPTPTS